MRAGVPPWRTNANTRVCELSSTEDQRGKGGGPGDSHQAGRVPDIAACVAFCGAFKLTAIAMTDSDQPPSPRSFLRFLADYDTAG